MNRFRVLSLLARLPWCQKQTRSSESSPLQLPRQISKYQHFLGLMSKPILAIRNETHLKALFGKDLLNLSVEICWKLPVSFLPVFQ